MSSASASLFFVLHSELALDRPPALACLPLSHPWPAPWPLSAGAAAAASYLGPRWAFGQPRSENEGVVSSLSGDSPAPQPWPCLFLLSDHFLPFVPGPACPFCLVTSSPTALAPTVPPAWSPVRQTPPGADKGGHSSGAHPPERCFLTPQGVRRTVPSAVAQCPPALRGAEGCGSWWGRR